MLKIILKFIFVLLVIFASVIFQKGISKSKDSSQANEAENKFTSNNDFEMNLYTDKEVYKSNEKIKIWATLKYIGNNDYIEIWHGEPYMVFSITNGKDFNIEGLVLTILRKTTLEQNKLYHFDYHKSGGYDEDGPNASYWKAFYKEKDLILPIDEYTISVAGNFSFKSDMKSNSNLLCKLKIKVEK